MLDNFSLGLSGHLLNEKGIWRPSYSSFSSDEHSNTTLSTLRNLSSPLQFDSKIPTSQSKASASQISHSPPGFAELKSKQARGTLTWRRRKVRETKRKRRSRQVNFFRSLALRLQVRMSPNDPTEVDGGWKRRMTERSVQEDEKKR